MEKIDFKKKYPALYNLKNNTMSIVEVPEFSYLMVDGTGDPNNSTEFQQAIEALFSLSYTIKFMVKNGPLGIDYGVMPLEGQWYMDNMKEFSMERKSDWKWTIMIMQPDFITKEIVSEGLKLVKSRKNLPSIDAVLFKKQSDGLCAHTLYTGPYSEETETIIKLHQYITHNGYKLTGKHREIYLNDMRRTAPAKLKTIIRQPITKA